VGTTASYRGARELSGVYTGGTRSDAMRRALISMSMLLLALACAGSLVAQRRAAGY